MSWIDGLRHRLHVWLHGAEYARERAEEMRFHRDMEETAGAARDDEWLPELPSLREDHPMLPRLIDWIRQDLGYAVRSLARSPAFTVLALLTLGLGVGANAAVFSVLDRLFGQAPSGLMEADGLRRLYIHSPDHPFQPGMIFPFWNYPAFSAVDEAVSGAGEVAGWTTSSEGVVRADDVELTVRRSYVSHDYFSVLGVRAARGRLFGADEARIDVPSPVAVISHAFWERAFGGDPGVVGRTFASDSVGYTIIGITEQGFAGLDLSFTDVFLPLSTFPVQGQLGLPWYQWNGNYLRAVARVSRTTSDQVLAERAAAGFQRRVLPERAATRDSSDRVIAGSIVAARGAGREAGAPEERQALAVSVRAAGVSAIVLLIAFANVAGLVMVRSSGRRREIAMRLALGITRGRLAAQLVTEGLVLGALVAVVAVLLGMWGGTILRALLLPEVAWGDAVLDRRLLVFAIGAALALGVLSAVAPALQAARLDVNAGLKGSGTAGAPVRSGFRAGLVVAQAALAVVLLIGAGLFIESLRNLGALRLGFDVDRLAWINPGRPLDRDESDRTLRDAVERLAMIDGVSGIARAQSAPMRGYTGVRIFLAGGDSLPPIAPDAYPAGNSVSPEFFAVTGMQILQGRGFTPGEQGVVVVSETMSRTIWPGEGALGKCLVFGQPNGPCLPVVGVAEDSRRSTIVEEPTLHYFLPRADGTAGGVILLRVDAQRWGVIAASVRQVLEGSFEPRSIRIGRMTETLEPQLRPWRLGAQLFTAFGALALLVTVVGVYGVMAYSVNQRKREIGVRMAIGARPHDVLRLILGEGMRTVSVGVVVGIVLALGSGRLIESLLYGVTPRDASAMAAAAAVLLATAAAASLVPAWRAARVDPSSTLREE